MKKEAFDKLWNAIAENEINETLAFCSLRTEQKENNRNFRETVYSRYESERAKFRKLAGIKESDKLDRHKVAALFYIAFVDDTDGYSFSVFGSRNERLREAEAAITHETAFNITIGILETFIQYDNDMDESYRKYVEGNGIVEPELICFGKNIASGKTSYKKEALKQLVYAQREQKLSAAQLALMFFSLENNTRLCCRLAQASGQGSRKIRRS